MLNVSSVKNEVMKDIFVTFCYIGQFMEASKSLIGYFKEASTTLSFQFKEASKTQIGIAQCEFGAAARFENVRMMFEEWEKV